MVQKKTPKVSSEEFVLIALTKLRDHRYKGIHVVYSGFNEAFRTYFKEEGLDPIAVVRKMADDGKLKIRLCRGGVKMFLPHEISGDCIIGVNETLKKMGV